MPPDSPFLRTDDGATKLHCRSAGTKRENCPGHTRVRPSQCCGHLQLGTGPCAVRAVAPDSVTGGARLPTHTLSTLQTCASSHFRTATNTRSANSPVLLASRVAGPASPALSC